MAQVPHTFPPGMGRRTVPGLGQWCGIQFSDGTIANMCSILWPFPHCGPYLQFCLNLSSLKLSESMNMRGSASLLGAHLLLGKEATSQIVRE